MQLVFLLVAALAPVAVLIYYIYRRDKYKKEPVRELLKAFGYGILSVPIALCMSVPLSSVGLVPAEPSTLWGAVGVSFLGAAIPEEIAKYLMLLLFLRKSRFFDERMDGIVYASVVSMGLLLLKTYCTWCRIMMHGSL
jgi:RsiW-degrading membrane proteinase PrsW (M82 family)